MCGTGYSIGARPASISATDSIHRVMVLVALTMQQSNEWGLRGFDLTIGEGDLKERFSNEQVVLPMVELYASGLSHSLVAVRDAATKGLRRLTGEERWKSTIRPRLKAAELQA